MPTVIQVLEEMIADQFRHRATNGNLVLREADQNDYPLRAGVPHFAMRIDQPRRTGELDATLPFLRPEKAEVTCKCDLIVFVPDDQRLLVFLIEMKSLQSGKYLLQLRASREFARYLVSLMKLHGLGDYQPEFRGVLIKSRRIPAKAPTRQINVQFELRTDLQVYECDRSRPLSLSDLVKFA